MDTIPPEDLRPSVPCPFCSSPQVIGVQAELENGLSGPFAIECSRCGASGPKSDSLAVAIERWNMRKVLQRKRA
jgi:Lar family restriction alleviation protein